MIRSGNNVKYTHSRSAAFRELRRDRSLAHVRHLLRESMDFGLRDFHTVAVRAHPQRHLAWYCPQHIKMNLILDHGVCCAACGTPHTSEPPAQELAARWWRVHFWSDIIAGHQYVYDALCLACRADYDRFVLKELNKLCGSGKPVGNEDIELVSFDWLDRRHVRTLTIKQKEKKNVNT